MGTNGWRRLIVSSPAKISLSGNTVVIQQDEETVSIPFSQLSSVMIVNQQAVLSAALIARLSENTIPLVFCNQKHTPVAETVSLHHDVNDRLSVQMQWDSERKAHVWKQVLDRKLRTEADLLKAYNLPNADQIQTLRLQIPQSHQTDQIEGMAAKQYFRALFGSAFRRRTEDRRNAALNYGYSIFLSAVSRAVALHGFHPAIGIHHANRQNPFNLPCDLMEPFRFIVDEYVFCHSERELDWTYKKALIELTKKTVRYNGNRMDAEQAVECFVLDVLAAMRDTEREAGVLENEK